MNSFGADPAYRPSVGARERNPARAGVIGWTLAYLFVFAIGSGAAEFYSEGREAAYMILFGGLWVSVSALFSQCARAALAGLRKTDILLWFILVAMPLAFMIFENRSFVRGAWTSQLSYLVILFVGAVLGLRRDLRGSLVLAMLSVILAGVALNLFELLVHNNVWSIAPGRSAGWYVNPNGSSAALALFGILYFALRRARYRRYDVLVLALIFIGILATFSRGGFVLFFVCGIACVLSRQVSGASWSTVRTTIGVALAMVLVAWLAFNVVLPRLSLTEDASMRLSSIESSTFVHDYSTDRASGWVYAWAVFRESPMTGVGVLTSQEMENGPHNMMGALAMDMGVGPLLLYVWLIIRMIWLGVRGLQGPATVSSAWLVGPWLLAFSFSSHNVIYDPPMLLGLGIGVSLLFGSPSGLRSRTRVRAWSESIHSLPTK